MGQDGQVTFKLSSAWSDRPIDLPCGRCVGCRDRRAREWALRCVHEAQMHTHNSFITLTYSPEDLPNDGGLRIGDFQRFCKRLRKRMGAFRFYHCGEYGEQNLRPHYHAILFGLDFHQDRVQVQATPYPRFRSETLTEIWGLGHTDIGSVTYESAAYVARYVHKGSSSGARLQADSTDVVDKYTRVDPATGETWQVPPEYSTMSRGGRGGQGGIGAPWFRKYHGDVYPSDQVVHNGRKFPVPRFYDEQFLTLQSNGSDESRRAAEDVLKDIKDARARVAGGSKENSSERLAVRERCAVARLRLRRRDL